MEFSLKIKPIIMATMKLNKKKYQYSLLRARPSIVTILEKHDLTASQNS